MSDDTLISLIDAFLDEEDEDLKAEAFFRWYEAFKKHPAYRLNPTLAKELDEQAASFKKANDKVAEAELELLLAETRQHEIVRTLEEQNPEFRKELLCGAFSDSTEAQRCYNLICGIIRKERREGSFDAAKWGLFELPDLSDNSEAG